MLRRNRFKKATDKKILAWEIVLAIKAIEGQRIPEKPFTKARITVVRKSTGMPDPDGLTASFKDILDVLQPYSKRHPCGLGIIMNDDIGCVGDGPVVTAARVRRSVDQGTWVLIEGFE